MPHFGSRCLELVPSALKWLSRIRYNQAIGKTRMGKAFVGGSSSEI